jgi:hypothetical protein
VGQGIRDQRLDRVVARLDTGRFGLQSKAPVWIGDLPSTGAPRSEQFVLQLAAGTTDNGAMNYGIPGPDDAIIPFSVFIIESPSKNDLAVKQTEGKLIAQALHLAQIPHHLYLRKTGRSFRKLLRDVIPNHLKQHHQKGHAVVVHLSAHGNMHEIGLTDETDISWDEMFSWLSDINFECQGSLVLCMSSCKGAFAAMMTLGNVELPFRVVVGSDDEPK